MSVGSKVALVDHRGAGLAERPAAARLDRTAAGATNGVLPWPAAALVILCASVTLWGGLGAMLVWVIR